MVEVKTVISNKITTAF